MRVGTWHACGYNKTKHIANHNNGFVPPGLLLPHPFPDTVIYSKAMLMKGNDIDYPD